MGLLNKLGRAARTVGSMADAAIEIGKLNVRIRAEKATIEKVKARMGDMIWQDYDAGAAVAPEMAALCEQIRDGLAAIDILNSAVETIKERSRESQAGACCDGADDDFCGCGDPGCHCHTPMGAACECEDDEA